MATRRKLAAGNWKMNGLSANLSEVEALMAAHPAPGCDVLLCPPATLLHRFSEISAGHALATGGQDCHAARTGAHTGDTSAEMLLEAGATYVILGHSERRADHGETDAEVRAKSVAAIEAGLTAVICVGETLAERESGQTLAVIRDQLAGSLPAQISGDTVVLAYEPVWAIGSGLTPTLEQIAEVHDFIRAELSKTHGEDAGNALRLLYGGSVKPSNASDIFAVSNVDGALVGGASLKAADFSAIITALDAA
jgi:triosephosphate isomerase (TIM)